MSPSFPSRSITGPPKLDRRAWLRLGGGLLVLAVVTALCTWLAIGNGRASSPVYGNLAAAAAMTWTWDGSDFAAKPVGGSTPHSSAGDMAYDRKNGVVVLWDHGCGRLVMGFTGGCQSQVDQTWTWDGSVWAQQRATSAPSAIGHGAMLYDGGLGQVVYVNRTGQVWAWTGAGWRPVARAGAPRLAQPGSAASPSLFLVAAGYDEARHLLVLALPDTTWTWDGRSWSKVGGGIDAADRQSDPLAVYDAALGRLTYLGTKSVWTWDGSSWQSHPQPNLAGGTLAYDPFRRNVVGVRQDTTACGASSCPVKVWTWDGASWNARLIAHEPTLPLTRSGAVNLPMAFDEARGLLVLFASAT